MSGRRAVVAGFAGVVLVLSGSAAGCRIARVRGGYSEIPPDPLARQGPSYTRYWPRPLAWDDRSSARVDRLFALPAGTTLLDVARRSAGPLAARGWYLVAPETLDGWKFDPQVIVWQRDPDERLDLTTLWPVPGMSREQRLYGGRFPAAFLDEPLVVGWSWTLGGPRSPRPTAPSRAIVRQPR